MSAKSFDDAVAFPRYGPTPGQWTTVLLVGSASSPTGPFAQVASPQPWPGDTNPAAPGPHDVTFVDSSLDVGWFALRWRDAGGYTSDPTPAVYLPVALTGDLPAWLPTQEDVASLMFARARGELGEQTTFRDRPNPAAVQGAIARAWRLLVPALGHGIPDAHQPTAREVVVLMTALLLEPGFWPEEQRDAVLEQWEQWKKLLDSALAGLVEALQRDRDDGADGDGDPAASNLPTGYFGDGDITRAPGTQGPWPTAAWWDTRPWNIPEGW